MGGPRLKRYVKHMAPLRSAGPPTWPSRSRRGVVSGLAPDGADRAAGLSSSTSAVPSTWGTEPDGLEHRQEHVVD